MVDTLSENFVLLNSLENQIKDNSKVIQKLVDPKKETHIYMDGTKQEFDDEMKS